LRYKILVRDMKVFTILYNTGKSVDEIPFEEVRINKGDLISIKKSELSDKPLFGRIENVPVSMIASQDKDKLNGLVPGHTKF
jgi:hypothetical protein